MYRKTYYQSTEYEQQKQRKKKLQKHRNTETQITEVHNLKLQDCRTKSENFKIMGDFLYSVSI